MSARGEVRARLATEGELSDLFEAPFDDEVRSYLRSAPSELLADSGITFGLWGSVAHLEAVLDSAWWLAAGTEERQRFVFMVLRASVENKEHGPGLVRALAARDLLSPANYLERFVINALAEGDASKIE
jgi:hypothetical protein